MYAVVEIAGQQFKVARGQKVYVHRLQANEGSQIEFDRVLLMEKNGSVQVGQPTVEGAKIAATVVAHVKGDKVAVFKKKRRKTYQKWNNHRQHFTQILIQEVLSKGETVKELLPASFKPWTRQSPVVDESTIAQQPVTVEEPKAEVKPKTRKSPSKKTKSE